MKGRTVSKVLKFVAVLFAAVIAILKWSGVLPNCEIWEIAVISAVIAGNSLPIDTNMLIDKFTKKKDCDGR